MANKRTVGRVLARKVPLHKSRSDCLHTITAVIVVKGTIVSIGHNRKLRPSVYNQHTIHAEIDALTEQFSALVKKKESGQKLTAQERQKFMQMLASNKRM